MTPSDQGPHSIRVFVASAIDEAAREQLARAQAKMKLLGAGISWVAPSNIHLTLAFLGDVFDNQVKTIRAALAGVAAGHGPCSLAIQGLGFFGSPLAPKIIWAGLQGALQPLMALQAALAAGLAAAGFRPDTRKPFHPHLTLGRARPRRQTRELADHIQRLAAAPFGRLEIRQILLIQSHLTPQGPVYSLLGEHPLGGGSE